MTPEEILHEAYVSQLPEPGESCIDLARGMIESGRLPKPRARFELTVDHLEAPSALMAFAMHFEAMSRPLDLEVSVVAIPSPDPRRPTRRVAHRLWQYDDATATRVLSAPDRRYARRVSEIAVHDFELSAWSKLASLAGLEFGDDDVQAIAAVMTYPPPPPTGVPAWRWIQHVQFAASLVLSRVASGVGREVLFDVLEGPMDWTVDASIISLAAVADDVAEVEARLGNALQRRILSIPSEGYCCYELPLVVACLRQRGVPSEVRELARERFRALA